MTRHRTPVLWLTFILMINALTACGKSTSVDNEALIATRVAEELAVAVTLTASAAEAEPIAAAPTATSTVATQAATVTPALTDTPVVVDFSVPAQPVTTGSASDVHLHPSCGQEQHAPQADQITLNAFWGVNGYDLARMTNDMVDIAIQLDDQWLESSRHPAPLYDYQVPCGMGLPGSYWLVERAYVGQLAPGGHWVTVLYTFGELITDGYDANSDGLLNSYGPGGDTEWLVTEYVLIVQ